MWPTASSEKNKIKYSARAELNKRGKGVAVQGVWLNILIKQ